MVMFKEGPSRSRSSAGARNCPLDKRFPPLPPLTAINLSVRFLPSWFTTEISSYDETVPLVPLSGSTTKSASEVRISKSFGLSV